MSKTGGIILLFIMALMGSCKGPRVVSFTNPSIDFSNYETYRIASPREGEPDLMAADTSSLNREIEQLIRREIEKKDYQYNRRRADIRVHYNFIANNRTDIDINPDPFYRQPIYSPYYGYPYRTYQVRSRNFFEAILLIELKDTGTAKTVWQGSLDLRYTKKIKHKADILPDAIGKIFDAYPYKAGSNQPLFPADSIP